MLAYDHERTEAIVSRVIAIGRLVRTAVTLSVAIVLGGILALVGAIWGRDLAWLAGIVGLAGGLVLGSWLASSFTVTLEWMAQLLVAQGEMLAELKKR